MRWLLPVALCGCDYVLGLHHIAEPQRNDAALDDGIDAPKLYLDAPPPGTVCVGSQLGVHYCYLEADLGPMTVTALTDIDTDNPTCLARSLSSSLITCVIAASDLVIDARMYAHGTHPLVLVGTTSMVVGVAGVVDVSSYAIGLGAGGNASGCADPAAGAMQQIMPNTSGGGAGGSFAGRGGDGGNGGNGMAAAAAPIAATSLSGGCGGGAGGTDRNGDLAVAGGAGGGAVYLASGGTISILGKVTAVGARGGGAAGSAPSDFPGGAGGGTGGMIVVEGATIAFTGASVLLAAGAGGGAGGDGTTQGGDGVAATGVARAPGGTSSTAGNGGVSSGGGSLDGGAGSANKGTQGGAGGGGGAAGYIKLFPQTTVSTGLVVPTQT